MIFWISDESDVIHLLDTLRDNPELDSIYIIPSNRFNHIGMFRLNDKHLRAIFSYLSKRNQKITLRLVNGIVSPEGLQALVQEMHTNTTVETLDLSHSYTLSDEDGVMIASFLKENTTLTSLDLSKNYFNGKAAIAITQALMVNQTLKHLDLTRTDAYDNCSSELFLSSKNNPSFAKMLTENTTLISLTLDWHVMRDREDMLALAQSININKSLRNLNLVGCLASEDINIRDDAFLILAFKDNQTLRKLNLSNNNLSKTAEMLSSNSGLTELSLLEEALRLSDLVEIFKAIEERHTPLRLNIVTIGTDKEIAEEETVHEKSWDAIVEATEKERQRKMQVISNERQLMREAFVQGIHTRLGGESSVSTFLCSPIFEPEILKSVFAMADMQDPFQSESDPEGDAGEVSEEAESKTLSELSYSLGYSKEEDDKCMQDVTEELRKIDKQLQPRFTPSFSSASIVQMNAVASSSKSLKRKHEDGVRR